MAERQNENDFCFTLSILTSTTAIKNFNVRANQNLLLHPNRTYNKVTNERRVLKLDRGIIPTITSTFHYHNIVKKVTRAWWKWKTVAQCQLKMICEFPKHSSFHLKFNSFWVWRFSTLLTAWVDFSSSYYIHWFLFPGFRIKQNSILERFSESI